MTKHNSDHLPFDVIIVCKMCDAELRCVNPTATIDVVEDGEGGQGYLVLFGMPIRCPSCCMPYLRGVESTPEDEPA